MSYKESLNVVMMSYTQSLAVDNIVHQGCEEWRLGAFGEFGCSFYSGQAFGVDSWITCSYEHRLY